MNLGTLIHELLRRKPEVHIQGLGTFRRIHTSASFDEKRKVFLPPITFIEFEANVLHGYDFSTYLQYVNQIDKSTADEKIETAVSNIQKELNQFGHTTLDSLGQLVVYGDAFVFKAFDLSGFNYVVVEDKFFDKESVVEEEASLPVEEKQEEITAVNNVISEDEEVKADDTITRSTFNPFTQQEEIVVLNKVTEETVDPEPLFDNEEPHESKNNGFIYGLVAALAILVLGGIYYYKVYYDIEETPSLATQTFEDPIVETPIDPFAPDSNDLLVSVDSTFVDSTQKVEEVVPVEVNRDHEKFSIVIAVHPKLELAIQEAEDYNKKGFKHVKVVEPNLSKNLKRVIWDTYPTKEKRDSALIYVQKNINPDAWPTVLK